MHRIRIVGQNVIPNTPSILFGVTTLTVLSSVMLRHCERFSPGAPPLHGQGVRGNLRFGQNEIASSQTALLLRNLPLSVSFRAERGISGLASHIAYHVRDSSSHALSAALRRGRAGAEACSSE
jgi:hypothetical protein